MEQVSRRRLLGGGLAATALAFTGAPALSGCAPSSKEEAAANLAVKLPTYENFTKVKPDLPGDEIVLDGFLTYPTPVKSIEKAPGDGKPVTFMTNIPGAIPPAEDKNAFWQELNKRLGSELKISMASNDEYGQKFATRVAGGDLPDVLNIPPGTVQLPGLLKAKCLDLTEHLSGDAVKNYPFLANLTTEGWKACIFGGKIYGIPVPRGMSRTALPLYRADLLEAKGIKDPAPKNFEEFFDICKEMSAPKENTWSWSRPPTNYIKQMLKMPYNWKEEGGKFTNAVEVEEYTQALEAVRTMVKANVINPDAFTASASARKQWFNGGKVSFDLDSFVAWNQYYATNTAGDEFKVNMLDVPGYDEGEGTPWMGLALNNITAFNKDSEHSVETLLAMANWFSAPFGTEEYLFNKYGIEGKHYTLKGSDPIPTKLGLVETGIGVQYFGDAPLSLYYAGHPEVPKNQHAIQTTIAPRLISDASYGLYSETSSKKAGIIGGALGDTETQIVLGKKPVSEWKKAVTTWLDAGGEQIRTELQQAFADAADGK